MSLITETSGVNFSANISQYKYLNFHSTSYGNPKFKTESYSIHEDYNKCLFSVLNDSHVFNLLMDGTKITEAIRKAKEAEEMENS
jgi:hypothetical protein